MPTNLDPTGRQAVTRRVLSALRRRLATTRADTRGEDGFLLIEVIISALLVALVVVGTFNGFDVVNRLTTAQRQHEQAAVLAAASQEQVQRPRERAPDAAEQPALLHADGAGNDLHDHPVGRTAAGGQMTGPCSVSESGRQSGNAYRISSKVTWKVQEKAGRPAVTAASLITPPIGSSLEIDVLASPASTTGVSGGVTGSIKYKPEGTTGTATQSQTTGSEGCLLSGRSPRSKQKSKSPNCSAT